MSDQFEYLPICPATVYGLQAKVKELTARVAKLEAERAGETGTPKAEGRYWCEMRNGERDIRLWQRGVWCELRMNGWESGMEWLKSDMPVLRFHRLPGETYTEIPR